jgi:predicted RNA-binding Zn ribbon-like protein
MEPLAIHRAPGQLELVRALINTKNIEAQGEAWTSSAELRDWLRDHGLLGDDEPLREEDLPRMQQFRESLRLLLRANNGHPLPPESTTLLQELVRAATLRVVFAEDGSARLEPASGGVDGVIGRIMGVILAAMGDGSWLRLKACHNNGCQWAFYDISKNRSGRWCATTICGNRLKARAYRARRRSEEL